MYVHAIMHIYATQLAYLTDYFQMGKISCFCHLFGFLLNNLHLGYEVISWLCMYVHVIMHTHAMQPACNHECMSM